VYTYLLNKSHLSVQVKLKRGVNMEPCYIYQYRWS